MMTARIRRGILIFLFLVATSTIFVGCDEAETEEDSSTEAAAESEAATEEEEAEDEIDKLDWTFQRTSDDLPEPIQYAFNADDAYGFGVYQDAGMTLMTRYATDEAIDFVGATQMNLFFAGVPFENDLARDQGDSYLRLFSAPIEPGEKSLTRPPFGDEYYISYDDFNISLTPGEETRQIEEFETSQHLLDITYKRRKFDEQDTVTDEDSQHIRAVLWATDKLPYTPAFLLVMRVERGTALSIDNTEEGVDDYLYNQLKDELPQIGHVLAVELYDGDGDEPVYEMSAANIENVELLDFALEPKPIIDIP